MSVRLIKTDYFVGPQQECMIIPLWRRGLNSLEIARALSLPECEIYNRLPLLRERLRIPSVRIHGLSENRNGAS